MMGLFGKADDSEKDRKKVKRQVEKLMDQYDKEKIDGDTYMRKMLDLTASVQKKKRKE